MGTERVVTHKEPLTFMQRKIGHSQLRNMSETLKNTDWDDVLRYHNVNECYDSFIAHFTNIIDTHAPVTKTTIPYKATIREPWMTPGLIKSSRKRDQLYKKTTWQVEK
jgi:hypothetical protein